MIRDGALVVLMLVTAACGGRAAGDDPAEHPVEGAKPLKMTIFGNKDACRSIENVPEGTYVISNNSELLRFCVENPTAVHLEMPDIDFGSEVGLFHSERLHDGEIYHRLHDAWKRNGEIIVRLRARRWRDDTLVLSYVGETAKIPRRNETIRFVKLPLP